ncbi:putative alpha methylacyl-CoA racemase [Ilyonectria sp. MPI-CAGE-AT-0026]|nr:putative alpha methylacyl-CoA racemase [Ilyonectria sp. MPI-CAGE-AT-0026]
MENNGDVRTTHYSVPRETDKLLRKGILGNSLIANNLPLDLAACSEPVRFVGSDDPSIPINWRFAESIASLKGFEAVLLNGLLSQKYGIAPQEVVIDTDHAQLFLMTPLLTAIDPQKERPTDPSWILEQSPKAKVDEVFGDNDPSGSLKSLYRMLATNIYKTKDERYFHLHASLDVGPSLKALGLPQDAKARTVEEAVAPYAEAVGRYTSEEIDKLINDDFKEAGTICWTPEEYASSEQGRANADTGLYRINARLDTKQGPAWWPSIPETGPDRPLAGLKVVDLARIIAGPCIARGLAEYGASVIRVTAPHLPDFTSTLADLNWGKWTTSLDLRNEEDRNKLKELIISADVVVDGYRPGVMAKYGFAPEDIFALCKERERGIIVARENCYGWEGPLAGRSGWQQISDASVGVSMEFGRAMGNDEPVTPVFPNSDFCTGVSGTCAILDAILRRGRDGGSYLVDVALNYYSQWLVNSCGTYSAEVWDKVWTRHGRQVFRHYHNMVILAPAYIKMLKGNSASTLFKPAYFEERKARSLGVTIRTAKPVLTFPAGVVKPGYQVGTRRNGSDAPKWPEDLMVESIA